MNLNGLPESSRRRRLPRIHGRRAFLQARFLMEKVLSLKELLVACQREGPLLVILKNGQGRLPRPQPAKGFKAQNQFFVWAQKHTGSPVNLAQHKQGVHQDSNQADAFWTS